MSALSLNDMVAALRLRDRKPVATGAPVVSAVETESVAHEEDDEQMLLELAESQAVHHAAEMEAMDDLDEEIEDCVIVTELPKKGDLEHMFRARQSYLLGVQAPVMGGLVDEVVDFCKPRPAATHETPEQPVLNVVLPSAKTARAPMSSEEAHVKRWFDEAFAKTDLHMQEGEANEWIQCDLEGHKVVLSQERMHEIGLVMSNGQTPVEEDPAELYWIQDKPTEHKDKYGVWDPVGAQWRIFPDRTLVPIEQRIAPLGKGCGGTPEGQARHEADTFVLGDYGAEEQYTNTALEPALPFILEQIEALGQGVEIPSGSGWAVNAAHDVSYYTPHLRHVQIDTSISEATGKKYVYGFFTGDPVKPIEGEATWDLTNSVWVYPIGACHKAEQKPKCCADCPTCSEEARDTKLGN